MPAHVARSYATEDYWNRMLQAEYRLQNAFFLLRDTHPANAKLCSDKSMQLSDRYHEHWTTTRKEYFG